MASFTRLRSGRIHPDDHDAGSSSLRRAPSLRARSFRRMPTGKSDNTVDIDTSKALTDEEHAEWLLDKLKHDGWRSTVSNLKFFGRMMKPIAVVAAWIFWIYAAISWAVPNLLCNSIAKEVSGSLVFGECLYIDTGGKPYSTNWGSKLFFLIYWSIQNGWMVFFCGYISFVLFGPAFRKRERLVLWVVTLLTCCISPVAGPRFGLSMKDMRIVLGVGIASGFTMMATSNAPARYTGNPLLKNRWIGFLMVGSLVSNIYFLLIPMVITARSQDAMGGAALTFMRVIVHPALWGILLLAYRFFIRNCGYIPEMRSAVFLNWPLIYASIYGRFLLLQMDSMSSVVIVNIIFGLVDLSGRLNDRDTDGLLLRIMYGERVRDALTAARLNDDHRMADIWMALMMDLSSIFAASALLSLGGVATSPGTPPMHTTIWVGAVLQAVTSLLFAFLGMALEGKYHHFEWSKSYTTRPALITLLIMLTELIGGSRLVMEILGIFCPTYYPDRDIILLEQCDKPSLFQAITFASADRFKMLGSYFNVTAGEGVNHST